MTADTHLLAAMRDAMLALQRARHERERAWALAGSGLLDPTGTRHVRMEAERALAQAHERVMRAKAALTRHGAMGARDPDGKAWGGH